MGGIRRHIVHFEHNPSSGELKMRLAESTGLALRFDEELEGVLGVAHPTRLHAAVVMDWIDKEHRHCIRIESETSDFNYIEVSVLYLLKELGGRLENDYPLPLWAGKKWADAWPRSPIIRARAWWNGTLPR